MLLGIDMIAQQFVQPFFDFLFVKVWDIAFVLIAIFLTWFFLRLLRKVIFRAVRLDESYDLQSLTRRQRYLMTFVKVFLNIVQYLVWFIMFVQILAVLGIQTNSFITIIGATGLTIGIIIRDIFVDMMNGFLILTEDQFRVGDHVTINGISGYVEEIGIRTTKLIGSSGESVIVANRNITNVTIYPEQNWSQLVEVAIPTQKFTLFEQRIEAVIEQFVISESGLVEVMYLGIGELKGDSVVCQFKMTSSFQERKIIQRQFLKFLQTGILVMRTNTNEQRGDGTYE
ncbi:MAG: mechanosensitive ion channel family protein [Culicoidibacterales bacterium]